VLLALLALLAAPPSVLTALGDLKPTPGAWAEYAVKSKKSQLRVRVSVLLEDAPAGRYWLELDLTPDREAPQAVRLLVHGDPADARNLERVELYRTGQAPIELPVDRLELPKPGKPRRVVTGPEERIQVPAGSFKARRLDKGDVRLWKSAGVPLWGLVKSQSPHETVELLSSDFVGAHSLFPSPPQGNGSDKTK
jgi:hypothetical protein